MGAGASTLGPTGVGKFQLTPDQKKQNDVLSNLFLSLLQNNNLVDLAKLVGRSDKDCNQLIITLSSQLEKEFQSLRFPDPSRQKTDITASYMAQDRYKILSDNPDSTRKQVCSFLATFLLRFVILISALTASISITDAIPVLAKTEKVPTLLKEDRTPVDAFFSTVQYKKTIENLKANRFVVAVEPDTELVLLDNQYFLDLRNGLLFKKADVRGKSKVLGVELGYESIDKAPQTDPYGRPIQSSQQRKVLSQFNPQEEYERELLETKMALQRAQMDRGYERYDRGYSGDYYREREERQRLAEQLRRQSENIQTIRQQLPQFQQQPQQPPLQQQELGLTPAARSISGQSQASDQSQLRSNIVRGERGQYSEIPKEGSEKNEKEDVFYVMMMRLIDIRKCPNFQQSCVESSTSAIVSEFYIDDYGRTYDVQAFKASKGTLGPQFSIPFSTKVEEALSRVDTEYIVGERDSSKRSDQPASTKKQMDFQLHEDTIMYLKSIEMRGTEIVAPAAFRAYLLATEVYSASMDGKNEQHLRYSFCKDSWSKKDLDDIPAYGLLAGLFKDYDNREGRMLGTSPSFDEIRNKMRTEGILNEGTELTNWKTKFPDVPEGLCNGKPDYYVINPENKARIQVLQAAHTKLRTLYDTHLRAVVEFVKTVLIVDESFLQALSRSGRYLEEALAAPVLRLHPKFSADPVGSFNVLQERSNAARKLLSDHYFQVEKVYKDTLKQLNDLALGIGSIKKGGRRTRKAHRKAYKSTRGKRTRRS